MELTPCQSRAIEVLKGRQNVFITGEAGTGKSFLIHRYLLRYAPKAPILASTGAAAVLVGGRTFHSFFSLGILEGGKQRVIERAVRNGKLLKRLREIDEIIIDEISMLPGVVLDTAEEIARVARESDEPWGGIRIVAVGDFAQLPPVTARGEYRDWAFCHPVWHKSQFEVVGLQTPVRFIDSDFYSALNLIRLGRFSESTKQLLNSRQNSEVPKDITHLYPWRKMVESFNRDRLQEITEPVQKIPSIYSGQARAVEALKKQAPVPEVLELKEGAYVMLQQNDPRGRWVNGSTGWIRDIGEEKITIELVNGKVIRLMKASFSLVDAEGEIIAEVVNFPLRLAYATTIHKSQGQTFDRAVIYLKGLWEPGQAYVALSRLRSSQGLFLPEWNVASFRVDRDVARFYQEIQGLSAAAPPL
ncbi:MAG: AAA family ATPase [Bdellovibrionales bacterium]|nr:AAA family ATPase [Bdellovibrionales bacterium]